MFQGLGYTLLFFQNECDEGNIALEVDDEWHFCCIMLCYIVY